MNTRVEPLRTKRIGLVVSLLGLLVMLMPLVALGDGDGSPQACTDMAGNVGGNIATADSGQVITAICIKSGDDSFEDEKHSDVITVDGNYDGFVVTGIGTATVTVDDSLADHEVSHIDYTVALATTTTVAPTTTAPPTTVPTTVADTTPTTVIADDVLGTVITTSTAPVVAVTPDEVLDTHVEAEELPFTGIDSDQLIGIAVLLLAGGLVLLGVTGKREDA